MDVNAIGHHAARISVRTDRHVASFLEPWMNIVWDTLTEPQAMIISALITVAAAVVGVLLGSWLFGSRVRDLQSALDASKEMVAAHREHVETSLQDVRTKLAEMETLLGTTIETIGQVRGSIGDLSANAQEPVANAAMEDHREAIRSSWEQIRDTLETIAADPHTDGRRRAKYARIDRRNYRWLIDSLDIDGYLQGAAERFREAVDLWHRFRNGRVRPDKEHADRMSELRDELVRLSPAVDGI